MQVISTWATVTVTFAAVPLAASQPSELERALGRLEQSRRMEAAHVLDECIVSIREHMAVGDIGAWRRLRSILDNGILPDGPRTALFDVALQKASAEIAPEIVLLASEWADEIGLGRKTEGSQPDPEKARKAALLGPLLRRLSHSPWTEWVGAKSETLTLLEKVIIETGGAFGIGTDALRALGESTAPIERRRAVAEAVVAAEPQSTQPAAVILVLLDESSLPKLRELARRSDDPDTFHYAAAAALAHLGDREILPDLEARRPAFQKRHINFEGYLIHYIWQINIQHRPSKLLDYIASTELVSVVSRRMWAVRRAVELGVPKVQIRRALLKHAKQVEPRVFRDGDGRKVKAWPGLSSLKKQGLKLGILRADDLPRVKVPKVEPVP